MKNFKVLLIISFRNTIKLSILGIAIRPITISAMMKVVFISRNGYDNKNYI